MLLHVKWNVPLMLIGIYIHTYVASKSGVKFPNIEKSLREFLLNRTLYFGTTDFCHHFSQIFAKIDVGLLRSSIERKKLPNIVSVRKYGTT